MKSSRPGRFRLIVTVAADDGGQSFPICLANEIRVANPGELLS